MNYLLAIFGALLIGLPIVLLYTWALNQVVDRIVPEQEEQS